jgi:hypothetical protein
VGRRLDLQRRDSVVAKNKNKKKKVKPEQQQVDKKKRKSKDKATKKFATGKQ